MFKNLSPGAVGIAGTPRELFALATSAGFEGIDPFTGMDPEALKDLYDEFGLRPGCAGLPVDFRGAEETYEKGMAAFAQFADKLVAVGCTRLATWLLPASNELPYRENVARHVRRLRPAAKILAERNIGFGLEFVGPATSRKGKAYEFVHTLDGVLELCDAIGTPNMGVLLDAWHWYTSGGTAEDLRELTADKVILVHVNDAPAGIPVDEQVDSVRDLPGATGVIDIATFLRALDAMGYDGPVTPEPFCSDLRAMAPADAANRVGKSMSAIWQTAGL
jgi:sugar phosphate isomerase/epimerase